jgi:hypothetical protein
MRASCQSRAPTFPVRQPACTSRTRTAIVPEQAGVRRQGWWASDRQHKRPAVLVNQTLCALPWRCRGAACHAPGVLPTFVVITALRESRTSPSGSVSVIVTVYGVENAAQSSSIVPLVCTLELREKSTRPVLPFR